jgi:intracellular sulfur oxidation DsrE/DsrF family protein
MKLASLILVFLSIAPAGYAVSFKAGPVIDEYGQHAQVSMSAPLAPDTELRVVFDVATISDNNSINRRIDSLARFINMHAANGVKTENINVTLVIHGKASHDLLKNAVYKDKKGYDNPNRDLLIALMKNQVDIFICGQSAAYYGIANTDLIEGVQMSLSAMTAHALLAKKGYSLNPF